MLEAAALQLAVVAGMLARLPRPWTSLPAGKVRQSSWAPLPWATTASSLAIAYRLIANLIRGALVTLALVIGLSVVGIDPTLSPCSAMFGLQKIVSNFVGGIIRLNSMKPGDVIEVGSTFGNIAARCALSPEIAALRAGAAGPPLSEVDVPQPQGVGDHQE